MKVYVFLILCVFFWSANFVIGRSVAQTIEPIELAFFRWFGVFVVTFPFFLVHFRKIFKAIKEHFVILSVLSGLGIAANNTLLYIGLQETTAINALLINSCIPMIILFLSVVILKKKITFLQTFGIALSTFGVSFLVLKGDLSNIFLLNFNQGDFWVIASSSAWAVYSVFAKFRPSSLSNFEFFLTIVFMGVLMLLPLYLAQGYAWQREVLMIQSHYAVIFYVVIFTSIICYYLWHEGIAQIGAEKTGQFTHLMPIFGSFLAYIFLGEVLEYYHLIGIVLIGFGIYLSLFVKKKLS